MFCKLCSIQILKKCFKYERLKPLTTLVFQSRDSHNNSNFTWSASIEKHAEDIKFEYEKINKKLMNTQELSSQEIRKYSRTLKQLKPAVDAYKTLLKKRDDLLELASLAIMDDEFKKVMDEESSQYQSEIRQLEKNVIDNIIPTDEDDSGNAMLEIRAGSGGREAALFASEMLTMYAKLCTYKKWKFELLNKGENLEGGLKDALASVVGKNAYGFLKHEVGVHRVQRIPVTESSGRVHTSTVMVSVLPQPEKIDTALDMKDVRVDTYKASGAGGQHVNTTDSAVRVTHIPTGIVVSIQAERSQFKNKQRALQILSTRIYEQTKLRLQQERTDIRKSQFGTGHRSERIRTYNLPQDRITDHRINISIHGYNDFLLSGEQLSDMLEQLCVREKMNSLTDITEMKASIYL